ncbi:MAG TPA: 50S ribosomal protein L19 [Candidatus Nealsonbacteria bacterium]|uniref:50S ribosomal protein L19 n=1 Tax=marine sediment metagenome TaxID=412755 RepID=A0A0F9UVS0_9ZZZZ|nr:50S ribosomal protein L19 [Candidatus Nealsonbacteria bacterium]HEB46782.1 50S ribosomal protein L19 [Candidatus Nealsonbacteria bacterium]
MEKLKTVLQSFLKKNLPDIRPGDTVAVYQKIKEKDQERVQTFEGLVLARKHGKEAGATITVRKVVSGIGVEKIFPIHSPAIEKIEILKRGKVRRAKLYYLREAKGKKARLKTKEFTEVMPEEEPSEGVNEEKTADNNPGAESKAGLKKEE